MVLLAVRRGIKASAGEQLERPARHSKLAADSHGRDSTRTVGGEELASRWEADVRPIPSTRRLIHCEKGWDVDHDRSFRDGHPDHASLI